MSSPCTRERIQCAADIIDVSIESAMLSSTTSEARGRTALHPMWCKNRKDITCLCRRRGSLDNNGSTKAKVGTETRRQRRQPARSNLTPRMYNSCSGLCRGPESQRIDREGVPPTANVVRCLVGAIWLGDGEVRRQPSVTHQQGRSDGDYMNIQTYEN